MKMRRHAVCAGEQRHRSVPQTVPQLAPQVGLATGTYQDGDRDPPAVPIPSQFYQPSLIVHGGPDDGSTILISKSAITMGRLPDNDIVIYEPRVSRRHAEIVRLDTGFHIWDLGISNGTFVNQQHIGETSFPLQHGDQIRLANSNIYHIFSYIEALSYSVPLPRSIEESLDLISSMPELQDQPVILETGPDPGLLPDGQTGVPEDQVSPCKNEVYEGNVKLRVEWDGGIQLLIGFVTLLRTSPQVRVVRLEGNSPTDVVIWLALREPFPLEQMLAQMEGVSQLNELTQGEAGPGGPERILEVRLSREFIHDLPTDLPTLIDQPGTGV